MTTVVVSLWLTEPALPTRTSAAFAVLTVIGLGWVAFARWVLTQKNVLLVRHRLVAGRMAVAFCSVFVAGASTMAVITSQRAAWAVAMPGVSCSAWPCSSGAARLPASLPLSHAGTNWRANWHGGRDDERPVGRTGLVAMFVLGGAAFLSSASQDCLRS